MPTSRPFAYNTGSTISGTIQVGSLAVGTPTTGFTGSMEWWNGPDEDLGYVIALPVPDDSQPAPDGRTASLAFNRSTGLTESSFVELTNLLFGQSFTTGNDASFWLTSNGYWNSWNLPTPTPTPTPTLTPTLTATPTTTPTLTSTPTPTPTFLPPTVDYVANKLSSTNSSSYTFTGSTGGPGYLIFGISSTSVSASTYSITGMTIDGNAATELSVIQDNGTLLSYWGANVANTTSTIIVNFSDQQTFCDIQIYKVENLQSTTPIDSDSVSFGSSGTTNIDVSVLTGTNIILQLSILTNQPSTLTFLDVPSDITFAIGGDSNVRIRSGSESYVSGINDSYTMGTTFSVNPLKTNLVLGMSLR
jgi:hypothetical protein